MVNYLYIRVKKSAISGFVPFRELGRESPDIVTCEWAHEWWTTPLALVWSDWESHPGCDGDYNTFQGIWFCGLYISTGQPRHSKHDMASSINNDKQSAAQLMLETYNIVQV